MAIISYFYLLSFQMYESIRFLLFILFWPVYGGSVALFVLTRAIILCISVRHGEWCFVTVAGIDLCSCAFVFGQVFLYNTSGTTLRASVGSLRVELNNWCGVLIKCNRDRLRLSTFMTVVSCHVVIRYFKLSRCSWKWLPLW